MQNELLTSKFCYRTRTAILQGRQNEIGKDLANFKFICFDLVSGHPKETHNKCQVKIAGLFYCFPSL